MKHSTDAPSTGIITDFSTIRPSNLPATSLIDTNKIQARPVLTMPLAAGLPSLVINSKIVTMTQMHHEDGSVGYFIDHPEFYCDIEREDNGKWSVFFRDRQTDEEAFGEQS